MRSRAEYFSVSGIRGNGRDILVSAARGPNTGVAWVPPSIDTKIKYGVPKNGVTCGGLLGDIMEIPKREIPGARIQIGDADEWMERLLIWR